MTAAHDLFAELSARLRARPDCREPGPGAGRSEGRAGGTAWLGFSASGVPLMTSPTDPGRAVVIGGGIAGLASAALLAADGWSVSLFEASPDVGGRAGTWERDGFRFDTGPSWYLMPEVFEHFFRLLGTTAAQELDLVPLDPAYRVYSEAGTGLAPMDIRSGRDAATALFESIEPGAGAKLDAYLDSAAERVRPLGQPIPLELDTYETGPACDDPARVRRLPPLAPLLDPHPRGRRGAAGSPIPASGRCWGTRPSSSAGRRSTCRACTT